MDEASALWQGPKTRGHPTPPPRRTHSRAPRPRSRPPKRWTARFVAPRPRSPVAHHAGRPRSPRGHRLRGLVQEQVLRGAHPRRHFGQLGVPGAGGPAQGRRRPGRVPPRRGRHLHGALHRGDARAAGRARGVDVLCGPVEPPRFRGGDGKHRVEDPRGRRLRGHGPVVPPRPPRAAAPAGRQARPRPAAAAGRRAVGRGHRRARDGAAGHVLAGLRGLRARLLDRGHELPVLRPRHGGAGPRPPVRGGRAQRRRGAGHGEFFVAPRVVLPPPPPSPPPLPFRAAAPATTLPSSAACGARGRRTGTCRSTRCGCRCSRPCAL